MAKKETLLQCLVKELVLRKDEIKDPIETIYFGGGTPSLLSVEELGVILQTIRQNYQVNDNAEVTLEANPDDLYQHPKISVRSAGQRTRTDTLFKAYKDIGINRLSIGVQSFFNDDLQFMKRAHSAEEALDVASKAIAYFKNSTIDLIYGTPTLTHEKWIKNINTALDLGVNHISSYALTVEPGTLLEKQIRDKKIAALDDKKAQEQFYILKETLEQNNFIHYELSNFGKEGFFSKHNTSYWQGKSYLGIGPSAHSFNEKTRNWNVSNNTKYIKALQEGILPKEEEVLTMNDQFNEMVMIGLRTINGVSLQKVKETFEKKYYDHLLKEANIYLQKDWITISQDKLKTTSKGMFFADRIASDLFYIE